MPTIAFWNLGGRKNVSTLVEFIQFFGIEILITAEQGFDRAELIGEFTKKTGRSLYSPGLQQEIARVCFYSVFPNNLFSDVSDRTYASIKEYKPIVGQSVLISAVHLPSKLRQDSKDFPYIAVRLRKWIDEAEGNVKHDRTIVIGDFNMNPFEDGMVACDALNGVMDRRIAAKGARQVLHESHGYFYNPMWRIMGNSDRNALGSYYLGSGNNVHYFWDTFDQVLLRPSLLDAFKDDELFLIENIGNESLLADQAIGINSCHSDHLPILFKINT